jgi:hypothetical protein
MCQELRNRLQYRTPEQYKKFGIETAETYY